MTKYDYATLVVDTRTLLVGTKLDHTAFTARLNEYGAEGWELVNVFQMTRGEGYTYEVVAVLKRAVER